MEDNELIWENYITANWGYTNYNTPTSNKYTDIPSPTQDSYYQKGKFLLYRKTAAQSSLWHPCDAAGNCRENTAPV